MDNTSVLHNTSCTLYDYKELKCNPFDHSYTLNTSLTYHQAKEIEKDLEIIEK